MLDAQRKTLVPAFVMVDPFGVSGTPMTVLARILRGQKAELYVSFMYEALLRRARVRKAPECPLRYARLAERPQPHRRGKEGVLLAEFVGSDQTDFHTGQRRKHALVPMEDQGLIEIDPVTRKKKHTYPDGVKLRFV